MLNKNFHDFIALLEKHAVKYLIVGGYALGAHGFPRYTGDLDVFVAITKENAARLPIIFKEFGFTDLPVSEQDFLEEDFVVEIGREPLKIQVLTGIDGVTFNECCKRKVLIKDGDLLIPFIGFEDLMANKAASARPKDKLDLEELRQIKKHRDAQQDKS